MNTLKTQQRGAALIVGLILLAVLTLLTASSMNSSTLSLRMADNVKQQEQAQQATESALMQALGSTQPLTLDGSLSFDDIARIPLDYEYEPVGNAKVDTTVRTFLQGRWSAPTGCELDSKFGGSGCVYQHFELRAASTTTQGRGVNEQQNMGFYLFVPN